MEFPNTHYVPIDHQNKDSFQIFYFKCMEYETKLHERSKIKLL